MRLHHLFALIAMIPAGCNIAPAAAHGLAVPLCGGGSVTIPTGQNEIPGKDVPGCCAKGCHSSQRRKASWRDPEIDG